MRQRGQTTTFQTRLEISEHAEARVERHTHRRGSWLLSLDRTQVATTILKLGRSGLASQMGRPATGPVSTFPNELHDASLHLRQLHPGWGPNTLLAALKMDAYWRDQPLPSRARIATLLKQVGLTRRYQPHHDLIQPPRVPLNMPHQEWQMDAASASCGWKGWARSV